MVIDEPSLMNSERLSLVADAVEQGIATTVYLKALSKPSSCRSLLVFILRERGHSDENAEILACGATILIESSY